MTAKATINMLKNKSLPIFIISLAIIAVFVFSFFWYTVAKNYHRRTFIFPSAEALARAHGTSFFLYIDIAVIIDE